MTASAGSPAKVPGRLRAPSSQLRPAEIEAVFEALSAANPTPQTELNYVNPFTLLVAVVLSAQATDVGVNKATVRLSRKLIEDFGGQVPRTREALESLPGVGRKTANVVLNVAFGQPTIAVDTHIFRVANRTGLAPGKTPLEVEQVLERVVPDRFLRHAHHWLILHGRYVCKARKPDCRNCLIQTYCRYPDKVV